MWFDMLIHFGLYGHHKHIVVLWDLLILKDALNVTKNREGQIGYFI